MADQGMTDLVDGFKTLGKFIHEIFKSKYALYFLVMTVCTVMCAFLFKALLSKIPMFEGSGDQKVNTYGNVISWCLALLAMASLGWQTKGEVDALVNGLAGPWGVFMIVALSMLAGVGMYKNMESSAERVRRWAAIVVGGLVFFWITGSVLQDWGWLWAFLIAIIVGVALGFATNRKKE